MASPEEQWQAWVQRFVAGEAEVVEEFWRQYGGRLQGLAARHMTTRLERREGPEDIVQSACRTFLRRARAGQFDLEEIDSVWRLLCAITLVKIREKQRFHGRGKRSFQRERPLGDWDEEGDRSPSPTEASQPSPEAAVAFAEELQVLLAGLDSEERAIVELRLAECTNLEAAQRLGCSERTVRRLLKRVQARLQRILEEN